MSGQVSPFYSSANTEVRFDRTRSILVQPHSPPIHDIELAPICPPLPPANRPAATWVAPSQKRCKLDCTGAAVSRVANLCLRGVTGLWSGVKKVATVLSKPAAAVGLLGLSSLGIGLTVGSGTLDPNGTTVDYNNSGLAYTSFIMLGYTFQQLVAHATSKTSTPTASVAPSPISAAAETNGSPLSPLAPASSPPTPEAVEGTVVVNIKDAEELSDQALAQSCTQIVAQRVAEYAKSGFEFIANQTLYVQKKYSHPINLITALIYGNFTTVGLPIACVSVGMYVRIKVDQIRATVFNSHPVEEAVARLTKAQRVWNIVAESIIGAVGTFSTAYMIQTMGSGPYLPAGSDSSSTDSSTNSTVIENVTGPNSNSTLADSSLNSTYIGNYIDPNYNATSTNDTSSDSDTPSVFFVDPSVGYTFVLEYGVAAMTRFVGYWSSKVLNKGIENLKAKSYDSALKIVKLVKFLLNTPVVMVGVGFTLYTNVAASSNNYLFCLLGMGLVGLSEGFTANRYDITPKPDYKLTKKNITLPTFLENRLAPYPTAEKIAKLVKDNLLTIGTLVFIAQQASEPAATLDYYGSMFAGTGLFIYYLRKSARYILSSEAKERTCLSKVQKVSKQFLILGDKYHQFLVSSTLWVNINCPGPQSMFGFGAIVGISQDNSLNETEIKTSATPGFVSPGLVASGIL